MAYTDVTQVSNFLRRDLSDYEKAELSNVIAAVKQWLDKTLNSTFDKVTVATTRYYDGGTQYLDIDPCTTITKVESIGDDGASSYEYTAGTEYIAEPQNETVKRELRKRLARFPHGLHRIAVTALFTEYDGGVPADIQIAATRLVAGFFNAGKIASVGGNVASESLEGHSITYNTQVNSFEAIAMNDPTVASILETRKELYVDTYEPGRSVEYDDGGLLI